MQEKKLRDALQAIIAYIESGEVDVWDSYGDLLKVAGMADQALASTTEETEMEKLVAWLLETRKELLEETPRTDPYDRGYLNALVTVRDYITTQFGEEKGNADREGD